MDVFRTENNCLKFHYDAEDMKYMAAVVRECEELE